LLRTQLTPTERTVADAAVEPFTELDFKSVARVSVMGCNQSIEATRAADNTPSASIPTAVKTSTHAEGVDQSDGPSLPLEQHHHGWDDFAKFYTVIKHVTGGAVGTGLSSIYVVIKNDDHHADCTAEAVSDDADQEIEESRLFMLQVIDIKSVAPERRKAMKKEIQSLKQIQHPNSKRRTYRCSALRHA
jgi:hypothetical protein